MSTTSSSVVEDGEFLLLQFLQFLNHPSPSSLSSTRKRNRESQKEKGITSPFEVAHQHISVSTSTNTTTDAALTTSTSLFTPPKRIPMKLKTLTELFFVLEIVLKEFRQRHNNNNNCPSNKNNNLVSFFHSTQRDIYYRNTTLFSSTKSVSECISKLGILLSWVHRLRTSTESEDVVFRKDAIVSHVRKHFFCTSFQDLSLLLQEVSSVPTINGSITPNASGAPLHSLYSRERLGISNTSRSVMVGSLSLEMVSPTAASTSSLSVYQSEGIPLTSEVALHGRLTTAASPTPGSRSVVKEVLVVVEKECTMQQLVHHPLFRSGTGSYRYTFLCTRGYPCRSTQLFLQKHLSYPTHPSCAPNLSSPSPPLRILCLVDGDPHGLAILLTLLGLPFGAASVSTSSLPPPPPTNVVFAGIRLSREGTRSSQHYDVKDCIPLTKGDVKLLHQLETFCVSRLGVPKEGETRNLFSDINEEITFLKRKSLKCEIQSFRKGEISELYSLFHEVCEQRWGAEED